MNNSGPNRLKKKNRIIPEKKNEHAKNRKAKYQYVEKERKIQKQNALLEAKMEQLKNPEENQKKID